MAHIYCCEQISPRKVEDLFVGHRQNLPALSDLGEDAARARVRQWLSTRGRGRRAVVHWKGEGFPHGAWLFDQPLTSIEEDGILKVNGGKTLGTVSWLMRDGGPNGDEYLIIVFEREKKKR